MHSFVLLSLVSIAFTGMGFAAPLARLNTRQVAGSGELRTRVEASPDASSPDLNAAIQNAVDKALAASTGGLGGRPGDGLLGGGSSPGGGPFGGGSILGGLTGGLGDSKPTFGRRSDVK